MCSTPQLPQKELHHLEEILMRCKYPKWAINKAILKQKGKKKCTSRKQNPTAPQVEKKCLMVVPYSQGLCESYKTICNKYGIQVHFKGGPSLKKSPGISKGLGHFNQGKECHILVQV